MDCESVDEEYVAEIEVKEQVNELAMYLLPYLSMERKKSSRWTVDQLKTSRRMRQ